MPTAIGPMLGPSAGDSFGGMRNGCCGAASPVLALSELAAHQLWQSLVENFLLSSPISAATGGDWKPAVIADVGDPWFHMKTPPAGREIWKTSGQGRVPT